MTYEEWGMMPYRDAWERQKEIRDKVVEMRKSSDWEDPERIICVEHPHVFTIGFHGDEHNMLATELFLKQHDVELIRIERGGDVTYHGPGQLVLYPILNIANRGIGVKQYIEMLEDSVIEVLSIYGIKASSNNDAIGVWLEWGERTARKICAIGVKVTHGVTMHGLALNVNPDLRAFSLIYPCGITDKGVTSIANEIGWPVHISEVASHLTNAISRRLHDFRQKKEGRYSE